MGPEPQLHPTPMQLSVKDNFSSSELVFVPVHLRDWGECKGPFLKFCSALKFNAVNIGSTHLAMAAALRALGWEVISMVMVAVGVYARLMKHAEAALACLAVDPAILLIVVGVLMFLLTFCGCIGSLRENICLLQTFSLCLTIVFLLQLAAGILGFVFSDKARGKVSELINNAIVHYRDDLDLQNLIDFGQKKNMYFNCSEDNPSRERCSVPYSCCLPTPNQAVINTMCGQGMQALDYLEASKVIYTNGCIDKLVNWIHSNLFLLGGVALGLAIPQLVGILLSQVLVNQIKDQIKLQLYNQQHRADPWY
ncbi:hypothetical protein U0070_020966 [Myodes glareolus]|uniref:Tetraspanin n=1 Tax=Myodes glareolus TaxID=447135 RepID=A0AAW0II73_MYOGA